MKIDSKYLRILPELLTIALCTSVLAVNTVGFLGALFKVDTPGRNDFMEYWASAQLLQQHTNPYAASDVLRLEKISGSPLNQPLIMWNFPTALPLVLPLGSLSPVIGQLVWLLLLCASLAISVRLVWILHGRPETSLNVLAYTFAPAIGCLFARQVSLFILLGLVLFLYWHQSRPFLAGASLWLCLLKPHLFLPFGLVLLLWMVKNRSYKILAGTLSALAVSSIIVTLFDPMVWSHYIQMAKVQTVMDLQIPCISIMLRRFIKPHTLWIEYLPVLLASIWAIDYFRRHREDWDWLKHGSLLVLISLVAAPYSWFPDQAIAIPAILHGVYATRSRYLLMALALASAVFQVGIIRGVDFFHSPHYIWTGPAWVIWYLCAVHKKDAPAIHPSVDPNPRAAAVAS